jgi:hypothetical protein
MVTRNRTDQGCCNSHWPYSLRQAVLEVRSGRPSMIASISARLHTRRLEGSW